MLRFSPHNIWKDLTIRKEAVTDFAKKNDSQLCSGGVKSGAEIFTNLGLTVGLSLVASPGVGIPAGVIGATAVGAGLDYGCNGTLDSKEIGVSFGANVAGTAVTLVMGPAAGLSAREFFRLGTKEVTKATLKRGVLPALAQDAVKQELDINITGKQDEFSFGRLLISGGTGALAFTTLQGIAVGFSKLRFSKTPSVRLTSPGVQRVLEQLRKRELEGSGITNDEASSVHMFLDELVGLLGKSDTDERLTRAMYQACSRSVAKVGSFEPFQNSSLSFPLERFNQILEGVRHLLQSHNDALSLRVGGVISGLQTKLAENKRFVGLASVATSPVVARSGTESDHTIPGARPRVEPLKPGEGLLLKPLPPADALWYARMLPFARENGGIIFHYETDKSFGVSKFLVLKVTDGYRVFTSSRGAGDRSALEPNGVFVTLDALVEHLRAGFRNGSFNVEIFGPNIAGSTPLKRVSLDDLAKSMEALPTIHRTIQGTNLGLILEVLNPSANKP